MQFSPHDVISMKLKSPPSRSGYNVLLYGFGSKRALVERFARYVLTDGAVVSVNGFNPLVNAKQVALGVASAIVPGSHRSAGEAEGH